MVSKYFDDKEEIVKAFDKVENNTLSRYLALQLVALGFAKIEVEEKTGRVGRPGHRYVLTGKARGYRAIMKNRFKPGKPKGTALVVYEPKVVTLSNIIK